MQNRLTTSALALVLAAAPALAPALAQEDLVTRNRVGPADAENALTFRLTSYDLYSADPATAAGFEELFIEFITANPGWKIDTQLQTGNLSQEQARMIEQAQAGRGPDCAMVDSSQLATYKDAGVLTPMNAHFSDAELADFFPYVLDGITDENGDIGALWWFTDLRILFRNTEVIPEAPETWDAVKAAALASVEAGYEGLLFNGGRTEATTFDWLGNFWALGGDLVNDAGEPVFYKGDNRDKFLQAVGYYQDLVEAGAAPGRVTSIASYDDMLAAAAAGSTAMFVGGNWMYAQIQNTLPPEEAAKWDVSQMPGPSADARAVGTGGWTIASLSDDPAKVEMCAGIAKLYAGPGNAFQKLLPTSAALYDEYEVYSGPEFAVFAESLKNGRARPGVAIYPEISNQIQILLGQVMSGAATPEEALETAAAAVEAAYARQ